MTKDWSTHQEELRNLYIVQRKSLREVMRLMEGRHKFIASERSYRTQLQNWGYMKYCTQANPKPHPKPNRRKRRIDPSSSSNLATVSITQGGPSLPVNPSTIPLLEHDHHDVFWSTSTSGFQFTNFGQTPEAPRSSGSGQNEQDIDGKTQLHRAVISKDMSQVQTLLFAGADISIKDNSGKEPIHYSVVDGGADMLEQLLRYGADINAKDLLGRSPLHLAASGAFAHFHRIVAAGATLTIQDENGDTPLHLAISAAFTIPPVIKSSDLITLIESGCDLNLANEAGISPFLKLLVQSYSSELLTCIDTCLQKGGSITKCLPDGRTPLQIFLSRSTTQGFQRRGLGYRSQDTARPENKILWGFLKRGASVTTPMPSDELLVIHYFEHAFTRWNTDLTLAEAFCTRSPLDQVGRNGSCILHMLAANCRSLYSTSLAIEDLIEIQLQKGSNPNTNNRDGKTPLNILFTTTKNTTTIISRAMVPLLNYGADPWQQDLLGTCALFEAAKHFSKKNDSILRALLEADLQHMETRESDGRTNDRCCWGGWEKAAQSTEWIESKQHVLDRFNPRLGKIEELMRNAALSVLAGKHIHLAKGKFKGDATETESRHRYVVEILRDCRARDVFVNMKWVDYLLGLSY